MCLFFDEMSTQIITVSLSLFLSAFPCYPLQPYLSSSQLVDSSLQRLNFILSVKSRLQRSRLNRPFSYSTKEPGSSVIFIQFYTRGSIEWR